MIVRPPQSADAAAIAALLAELGYPAPVGAVAPRVAGLSKERSTRVVVAELNQVVVGLATGHAFFVLHVDHVTAYLTTLVVALSARRRGVGSALVEDIAAWARAEGAQRLSVVTGVHRTESHEFYERLGFERTALRYTKSLV